MEDFLQTIYDTLKKLKSKAILSKRNPPYLDMFFNIHGFFQKKWSAVKGLSHILNSLPEALNTCPRLPKYIVIIPDHDLIRDIDYFGYGASDVFSASIIWLATEFDKKIKRCTQQLFKKKPGTPKIIWVKVLKHPYNGFQEFDQLMALQN